MTALLLCGDRGIPLLGPSGASAHLRAIARALGRLEPVIAATPRRTDARGAADDDLAGVHFEPRSWRRLGPWRERGETWDARQLATAASLGPIDWIWERHSLFVDAGKRLQQARGVRRVVELNAPLSLERTGIRDKAYAKRVESDSLRAATRVLAVSSWLVDWAISEVGCDPARVLHLPNGSEVRHGDRAAGRQEHALCGPVAVWVGSCKPWHGLDRLPALADALPDWTIAVAGDGPVPVPTHARIRALGPVTGRALDNLLAAADVGLSTGDPDAMPWVCPLKIADYRAAGLPVIATASGDSAALVDRGTVLHPWTPSTAADAVQHWAAQPRAPRIRTWDQVVAEARAALDA